MGYSEQSKTDWGITEYQLTLEKTGLKLSNTSFKPFR